MKKSLASFFLLNFSFLASFAQTPQVVWDSFFNGNLIGADLSNSVVTDSAGNVYVTGMSYQNSSAGNFTTVKYNSAGVQQWTDHFSSAGTGTHNEGVKIVMDKWQNLYAIGTVASNSGDIAVVKYNANGRIWARNYEPYSFGSDVDFGVDICVDSSGNFYFAGQMTSLSGDLEDSYFVKCDSSGTKIFEDDYTSASGDDFPTAVAVTSNGNFFAQSNSYNFFGSLTYDIFTINYLNNGNQNWISRYNNPLGNGIDYGTYLKVDESSNQYVCGTTDAGTNNDMVMMKQNMFGTRLWTVTYSGTANVNDTAISETWLPNGLVVVTGKSKELLNSNTVDAFVTMVIDSGTVVWLHKYFGADSLGASPSQMITDAQGNIYICGYENLTGGTKNGCIIKYDSNGNMLWNISYDAGLNLDDKFNSITLDMNNNILVTGQTFTSALNSNYVTVKFGSITTGMGQTDFPDKINVYPNPASSDATIEFFVKEKRTVHISIHDLEGRQLSSLINTQLTSGNYSVTLNTSSLVAGVYFIFCKEVEHQFSQKLVVMH